MRRLISSASRFTMAEVEKPGHPRFLSMPTASKLRDSVT